MWTQIKKKYVDIQPRLFTVAVWALVLSSVMVVAVYLVAVVSYLSRGL